MNEKYDLYKLLRAIRGEPQPTMGGIPVPYIPTPISCWSNPLDEYKQTITNTLWVEMETKDC